MASIFWKLVVSPLSAQTETREAVVVAENWLSALRLARKQLGEEGGVPPGASCVMAATGEVTIVDMATRRRFVLARTTEPETKAKNTENAALIETLPQPIEAVSAETQATAPAPVSSAISPAPLPVAPAPKVAPPAPVAAPAPVVAAPAAPAAAAWPTPAAPNPAQAKPRASTMAYSPEESAAIRAQLVAATQPQAQPAPQPPEATAPVAPVQPTPAKSLPGASPWVPLTKGPEAPAPSAPEKRSTTVAYSPDESAQMRAQLVAAQKAAQAQATPDSKVPMASEPAQVAGSAPKKATVAYLQSPFAAGSSALVQLSSRDEEPSATSPLVYRERCYFSPNAADAAAVEQGLRQELATLRSQIDPARRGVFVSLALFDHYYQGKPQRGPVATLQWKDWRGEPVFAFNTPKAAAVMPTQRGEPVRTSFVPQAASPAVPPAVVVGAPVAPTLPAPPANAPPARREVVVGSPAPSAPVPTPARSARDSWPGMSSHEVTGDQDRRLAIAFEAVQDLYFLGSAAEGMDFGVKLLSELVPCEAVTGCIYDINTDELRFLALTGPGADERRAGAIPASAGLFGAATRSGKESLVIADVASDARFDPAADGRIGLESQNMLILPLHHAENLLGALQLINRAHRHGFTDADVAVSTYVSAQLSGFLQSKRLGARRPR